MRWPRSWLACALCGAALVGCGSDPAVAAPGTQDKVSERQDAGDLDGSITMDRIDAGDAPTVPDASMARPGADMDASLQDATVPSSDGSLGLDAGDDGAAPSEPAEGTCFSGGQSMAPSKGTGTCADAFTIDLTQGEVDDVFQWVTPTGGDDEDVAPLGKCGANLARDLVFTVAVPASMDLEVTVQGEGEANPVLIVQQGPSADCAKTTTVACLDETAAGECEYTRIRWGSDAFNGPATQIVVSEAQGSALPLTLHLRLRDPGSGS